MGSRVRVGRRRRRAIGLAATAVTCMFAGAASTYALTNSNNPPPTYVGDGTGAVSAYVVGVPTFNLNINIPNNIDSVAFTLDAVPPAGSTIRARLSPTGSWYSCTNTATSVACIVTSPQALATATTSIQVVIAQ